MPFIYPSTFDAEVEAILAGLEGKGLSDARQIHTVLSVSLEDAIFEDADDKLRLLSGRRAWSALNTFAMELIIDQMHALIPDALRLRRLRSSAIEVAQTALRTILADRDQTVYMPIPLNLLAAIELLFRSSVMRYRMWNRSQEIAKELVGNNFRLKDADDTIQFSLDSPPVSPECEIAYQDVAQLPSWPRQFRHGSEPVLLYRVLAKQQELRGAGIHYGTDDSNRSAVRTGCRDLRLQCAKP